jgi:hypothetical protein
MACKQGVRGSNPLSSTPGQRPSPPSAAPESPASGSKSDDDRQAQVELWARGIVPNHEALVRFFAEWQAWERQEIAADRIPTVLERRTYSGADLLARYQEWQAQRGSCRIDRQRHDQFQTLLLPERWSWLVALGPGFEISSSSSTPSATPATPRGSAPTLPGTEAQRPGRRSRPT